MKIYDALSEMALFIASRRQAARSMDREEQEKLWLYARDVNNFVLVTGQVYRFEDFLKGTAPVKPRVSARLSARKKAVELEMAREAAAPSSDGTRE